MGAAGLINVVMLVLAACALPEGLAGIPEYYVVLTRTVGALGAFLFLVAALMTSGMASSGVGTLAGEMIMAGFVQGRIPRPLRRLITLVPGIAVLAMGVSATDALVVSQLVLGLGIPFTLVPLIPATRDGSLMGTLVNRPTTTVLAAGCAAAIVGVDLFSLLFGGEPSTAYRAAAAGPDAEWVRPVGAGG